MKRFFVIALILLIAGFGILWFLYRHHTNHSHQLIIYGNVDIRQVNLGFRVEGRVVSMPLEEGDLAKPGQLIGSLDPETFQEAVWQASAHHAGIKASLDEAEKVFNRRADLVGDEAVSIEDYENALSQKNVLQEQLNEAAAALAIAETNFKDASLYAPAEGTILTRIVEPGTIVRYGDPIYTLSLTSPVWIRAYVNEPQLGNIYPGMTAEVFTDTPALPTYQGHIGFISPVAEFTPKNVETTDLRTDLVYRLRVIVDDPNRQLKQGMPVTIKLNLRN